MRHRREGEDGATTLVVRAATHVIRKDGGEEGQKETTPVRGVTGVAGSGSGGVEPIPLSGHGGVQPPRAYRIA